MKVSRMTEFVFLSLGIQENDIFQKQYSHHCLLQEIRNFKMLARYLQSFVKCIPENGPMYQLQFERLQNGDCNVSDNTRLGIPPIFECKNP